MLKIENKNYDSLSLSILSMRKFTVDVNEAKNTSNTR